MIYHGDVFMGRIFTMRVMFIHEKEMFILWMMMLMMSIYDECGVRKKRSVSRGSVC